MSTVISGGYPMIEKLHKDFQSNVFGRDMNDYGLSLLGSNDNITALAEQSLAGMWALQGPMNLPRRNSTSSVSSISSTRNRMNLNSLTSMANAIPETTTATITAAISSLPTLEERFRGRAYSEGASSLSSDPAIQPQQQPVASSRYKTELCRPFEENGKCKYGDKCQFAHGKQELRHLVRHPKYKTELCRTFHTSGFCPYGPRCHFIHNQDDSANRNGMPMAPAPTVAGLNQAGGKPISHGVPIAVPTPHISERNHYNRRPAQLNLLSKKLSNGSAFGPNVTYSGPATQSSMPGSPPFFDMGCSAVMSPTSPSSGNGGSVFNFPSNALANMMQCESPFEMLLAQGSHYESTVNDDSAFDGPPTPPDSDRESMTGSPPEKQRLPIFRCLSQS